MSAAFDLSAFDGLENDLSARAARLEKLIGAEKTKTKIKTVLRPITQDAKARVNSVTGNLVKGIETRVTTSADEPTKIEVGISYKRHKYSRHAHLVEGGHKGPNGSDNTTPPHPFWEPAVRAHGDEAVKGLEDALMDAIDEAFG